MSDTDIILILLLVCFLALCIVAGIFVCKIRRVEITTKIEKIDKEKENLLNKFNTNEEEN